MNIRNFFENYLINLSNFFENYLTFFKKNYLIWVTFEKMYKKSILKFDSRKVNKNSNHRIWKFKEFV